MSTAAERRKLAIGYLADLASMERPTSMEAEVFRGASAMFRALTGFDPQQVQRLINAELRRRKAAS